MHCAALAVLAVAGLAPMRSSAFALPRGSGCEALEFKDYSWGKSDLAQAFSVLNVVDSETWKSLRRDASGNVTLPIQGVPVSFGATYDSFDSERTKLFTDYDFRSSKAVSDAYVEYRFSNQGAAAYGRCVDAQIAESRGLHLIIEDATEGSFNVSIYNNQGGTRPLSAELEISQSGTPATITKIPGGIAPGAKYPVPSISRDPTKDLSVAVRVLEGVHRTVVDGDRAFIPATPVVHDKVESHQCFGRKDIQTFNDLYEPRLQALFPAIYSARPNGEGLARALGAKGYFYAAGGAGRDWEFDVSDWGVPAGADLVDATVAVKPLNAANSDQFVVRAGKQTPRVIQVNLISNTAGAISEYEISYRVNLTGSGCPVLY